MCPPPAADEAAPLRRTATRRTGGPTAPQRNLRRTNPGRQHRLGGTGAAVRLRLPRTFVEVRRGADLSDGGAQLDAEGAAAAAAAAVHARQKTLFVLQLHSVKV